MAKMYEKADVVDVEQWRRLGDLPGDKPYVNGEPRIVKAFKSDTVAPTAMCPTCKGPMSIHGWIEPPAAPVAAVAPSAGYPQTFAKAGETDEPTQLIVTNEEERDKAYADGYRPLEVAAAAPVAPVIPLDPNRGDLKGLIVCPGYFVAKHLRTGEYKTVPAASVPHLYGKDF